MWGWDWLYIYFLLQSLLWEWSVSGELSGLVYVLQNDDMRDLKLGVFEVFKGAESKIHVLSLDGIF